MSKFRKTYRVLSEGEKDLIERIKSAAEALDLLFGEARDTAEADPRMVALAGTKLEESVMWATKAIT